MAAAKIGSSRLKLRSGFSVTSRLSMVPPAAASPPAMIHVARATISVSMPETRARSALSDVARIALPRRDRVRK